MPEQVKVPKEQAHYDAVMQNYDRVLLEDKLETVKLQLKEIEAGLADSTPNPDMPYAAETEVNPEPVARVSTARSSESREARTTRERRGSKTLRAIGAVAVAAAIFVGGYAIGTKDEKIEGPKTALANGGTDRGTEAADPAKAGGPALTGAEKRLDAISGNRSVNTLDEAARAYKASNPDQAVSDILGNRSAVNQAKISHDYDRFANLVEFGENMKTQDAFEAKLKAVANSPQNSRSGLNSIEGKPITAPRDDTHVE